jgi:hypothetical protein
VRNLFSIPLVGRGNQNNCLPRSIEEIHEQTQKIHLDNLRRNLERRLQAAKANGNDYLIDLLEAESKHLEMNI